MKNFTDYLANISNTRLIRLHEETALKLNEATIPAAQAQHEDDLDYIKDEMLRRMSR